MTPADRRIAVGLFVVTFVTFAYFHGAGGWNQNAQWDLTRAIVERHTFQIDEFRKNTGDISWSDSSGEWHAFANKPPGVSMLAAIPYALLYRWQLSNATNAYLVTVLVCAVCGALIPVVIFLYGLRRRQSPLSSTCVALSIALGTIVFPYSTVLFAHVPSALFLLLAFVWLDERPFLAGVCAGIASLCFYVCIPAALTLVGAAALSGTATAEGSGRHMKALRFILGGIPFAILLGWYHYVCFGSPFRHSVEGSKNFTQEGLLFGVLRKPSTEALWGLTFSEYRGLFFLSPILLLAFVGAVVMIRKRVMLKELAAIAAIFIIFLMVNASFNGWEGGFAFGPRYLLPAIPLLAIPMLFAWRNALLVVTLLSVAIQFVATAVNVTPDGGIRHPLREYLVPAFVRGELGANEQSIDDLVPQKGSRAAFNLGERVLPRRVSWMPIALWMLTGSSLLILRARQRR
ncbi:MAG TPA: hypothetical protein VKB93_29315 [Thermoanaerobaculia bacterium]|nr:hypothetical protein [Thermoanaerobaculia bacterium]